MDPEGDLSLCLVFLFSIGANARLSSYSSHLPLSFLKTTPTHTHTPPASPSTLFPSPLLSDLVEPPKSSSCFTVPSVLTPTEGQRLGNRMDGVAVLGSDELVVGLGKGGSPELCPLLAAKESRGKVRSHPSKVGGGDEVGTCDQAQSLAWKSQRALEPSTCSAQRA